MRIFIFVREKNTRILTYFIFHGIANLEKIRRLKVINVHRIPTLKTRIFKIKIKYILNVPNNYACVTFCCRSV